MGISKISLLAFLILSFSVNASITNSDFSFNASVKETGDFVLNIDMQLPKTVSFPDTFYEMFFNESNLLSTSQELKSSETSINMLRALLTKGTTSFVLNSTATKNKVTAEITNACDLTVLDSQIKVDCSITKSSTFVGKVFHYGTNSFNCIEQNNNYKCNIRLAGRPVKITIPFYTRSEERLAVSGISNTVENYFKTYYHYGLGKTLSTYSKGDYFKMNLADLWGKMIVYLKDEQELNGILNVSSDTRGVLVSNNKSSKN